MTPWLGRGGSIETGSRLRYAHQECCALCAADPECLYFMLDLSTKVFEGQPPLCYIGGDALPPDAVVANGENPLLDAHERYEVSVMDSSDKRGLLCTVCRCDGATADCRGADLAFVPVADASFSPRRLDLSENLRLQLIDPGAFEGMTDLAMLTLPAAAAHVSPEALRGPALRSVAFAPGDSPARTWVAADSPTDFFQEFCCGRADLGVDGVKACDWTPKSPGIDCEYLKNLQIHDVDPLYVVTTDSFFMAEAAESATKCGAVCELADNCHAFTYVDDTESCYLFPSGFRISFAEVEGVSLTSGLSPRARAELRNAVVLAEPSVVELSEGTGHVRRADIPWTGRGDAAAATWIFRRYSVETWRGDAAAATWIPRGYSVETCRGDAEAATWMYRGDRRAPQVPRDDTPSARRDPAPRRRVDLAASRRDRRARGRRVPTAARRAVR